MRPLVPPPIQGVLTLLVIWALSHAAPGLNLDFPGRQILSGMLIVVGLSFEIFAFSAFRRAKTTVNPLKPENASRLVVTGLYRYTRNPMYLGMLLLLCGLAIGFGNILGILALIAFVLSMNIFQIKPEERALTETFGATYVDYCKQVRRWI